MNNPPPPYKSLQGQHTPLRIAAIYTIVGSLWILLSDRLLATLTHDPATLSQLQTLKGWFYVLTSGALLYALVRRDVAVLLRSAQAHWQNETQLHLVVDQARAVLWTTDRDLRFTSSRGAGLAALDLLPDQVVGQTLREYFQADDPDFPPIAAHRRALSGESTAYEQAWGSATYQTYLQPLRDAAGEIAGVVGVSFDVTERKKAEQALRESEAHFRALVEQSLSGIVLIQDGKIAYINPRFTETIGYSPEELIGSSALDLVVEADRDMVSQNLRKRLSGEVSSMHYTFRARRKDGTEIDLEAYGSMTTYQGRLAIMSTLLDITERKRAEDEIRRRARELEAINTLGRQVSVSLSLDQVVEAALEGITEAVAPDLALLFLRESDRLILRGTGPKSSKFAHPETPEHHVGECLCRLTAGEGEPIYARDIYADPRCTWQECKKAGLRSFAALPLRGEDGTIGVLGVASGTPRDFEGQAVFLETLADQVALGVQNATLYAQVRRYAAELEQRVARRTAELQVAMEKVQETDRLKSAFLATMSHELRTPLNSIIGFTGIILQGLAGPLNAEQAKQLGMVQNSARHLLALINDVLDISKIEAGQFEIVSEPFDVRDVVDKAIQTVAPLADRKGLTLVARVAPEVGQITSDRRRVEQVLLNLLNNAIKFTDQGEVQIECRIDAGRLATRVMDTGMGIRPEGRGETILLVEDNEKVRRAGQMTLQSLNYRVLTARNGREALEVCRSAGKVDLVLTDVVMPEMGGIKLIQELRKMDPGLRVLVLTGYLMPEDMEQLAGQNIQGIVHKPLDAQTLAQTVRKALDTD